LYALVVEEEVAVLLLAFRAVSIELCGRKGEKALVQSEEKNVDRYDSGYVLI